MDKRAKPRQSHNHAKILPSLYVFDNIKDVSGSLSTAGAFNYITKESTMTILKEIIIDPEDILPKRKTQKHAHQLIRCLEIDGCWIVLTPKGRTEGYPQIGRHISRNKRKTFSLAHLMYEHYKGKIPKGMFVCHTCDNPACINPKHLWLGTAKENWDDCIKKGRRVLKGE